MATVFQFNGGREVARWERVKDASVTRLDYGRAVMFHFLEMSTEPGNPMRDRRVTVSGDWAVVYEPETGPGPKEGR